MKGKKVIIIFFVILLSSLIAIPPIWSHSGRTDASGGHTNRKTGQYHYHGGAKPVQQQTYTPKYEQQNIQKDSQTKEGTVYITKTGKKYHSSGCRYLSSSQYSIEVSAAIFQGYTACSVCGGIPYKAVE